MVGVENDRITLNNLLISTTNPEPRPAVVGHLADVTFGSVAGFFGKLVEHPFDTIKVRLQTQPFHGDAQQPKYKGPVDCAVQSVKQDGLLGLYRGISSPLLGSMLENAVLFVAYNQIQKGIVALSNGDMNNLSLKEKALAGALSGTAVSLVLTPVELVKCQMQVDSCLLKETAQYVGPESRHTANPYALVENVFLRQRIAGRTGNAHLSILETSVSKNFANLHALFPNRMSVFVPDLHYNSAHLHYATHPYPHSRAVYASLRRAELCASDKKRLIVVHRAEYATNMGATAMFRHIFKKQGLRGLYTGNISTILRETAGGAAWFGTYEYAKAKFLSLKGESDSCLTAVETMTAGALAGMAYNAALFPADVIKTRQQALSLSSQEGPSTMLQTAQYIWAQGGVQGFYRGFGITIVRSIPASAVIFLSYEMLKKAFVF